MMSEVNNIRSVAYALAGISTGCLIHLCSLFTTVYYVCGEYHDSDVVLSMAVDIARIVFGVLVFFIFQVDATENIQPQAADAKWFVIVCAVGCVGVFFTSIVTWQAAVKNCMTPTDDGSNWNQQLGLIIPGLGTDRCVTDSQQVNLCRWDLQNYQIMYDSSQWCRKAMRISCPRYKDDIHGMQRCLRSGGAGDFSPSSKYSQWIDLVGDLSRIIIFAIQYHIYSKRTTDVEIEYTSVDVVESGASDPLEKLRHRRRITRNRLAF